MYQPDMDANKKTVDAPMKADTNADLDRALDFTAIGQLGAATELSAADPLRHAFSLPPEAAYYDKDEERIGDDEMVTGRTGENAAKEAMNGGSAPKSMQELAEEIAAKRSRGEGTSLTNPTPSSSATLLTATNRSTVPADSQTWQPLQLSKTRRRAAQTNGTTDSKRSTPAKTTNGRMGRQTRAAAAASGGRRSGRHRKRFEKLEESNSEEESEDSEGDKELHLDSDDDDSSGLSEPPDTDGMSAEDDNRLTKEPEQGLNGGQDVTGDEDENTAVQIQDEKKATRRGQKRKRTNGSAVDLTQTDSTPSMLNVAATAISAIGGAETPSTGRVLRPRAPKTAAKLQAEREAERAFRRAIAE